VLKIKCKIPAPKGYTEVPLTQQILLIGSNIFYVLMAQTVNQIWLYDCTRTVASLHSHIVRSYYTNLVTNPLF